MLPMYYRRANAAIIVYDVTSQESFLQVTEWINGTFMYMATCSSCNTGKSALPDMYAQAREHPVSEGKCGHIRQSIGACVATNMLRFR